MSAPPSSTVFLGSIPTDVAESEVRAAAAKYGAVSTFRYSAQPSNRGWAIMTFSSEDEARAAISGMNGQLVFPSCIHPIVSRFANDKSAGPRHQGLAAVGGGGPPLSDSSMMHSKQAIATAAAAAFHRSHPYGMPSGGGPVGGGGGVSRFGSMLGGRGGPMGGGGPAGPGPCRLPPSASHWITYYTQEGHPYYYNIISKLTQWEKPIELMAPQPIGPPPVPLGAPHHQPVATASIPPEVLGNRQFGPPGCNLFVFHIPTEWDHYHLYQHFQHFGTLISARVKTADDGVRNLGYGFVSYDSPNSAFAAIKGMHGFHVGGKWLKVTLKKGEEHMLPVGLQMLYDKQKKTPESPPLSTAGITVAKAPSSKNNTTTTTSPTSGGVSPKPSSAPAAPTAPAAVSSESAKATSEGAKTEDDSRGECSNSSNVAQCKSESTDNRSGIVSDGKICQSDSTGESESAPPPSSPSEGREDEAVKASSDSGPVDDEASPAGGGVDDAGGAGGDVRTEASDAVEAEALEAAAAVRGTIDEPDITPLGEEELTS